MQESSAGRSVLTVPVLGAAGFEALGPAAGTAAASWQASLGLVKAGSLFVWCQITAMGGAAVGGIQAVGTNALAIACTTWTSVVDMQAFLINKVIARDLPRAGSGRKATSRPGYRTPRTPQLRAWEIALCLWTTLM